MLIFTFESDMPERPAVSTTLLPSKPDGFNRLTRLLRQPAEKLRMSCVDRRVDVRCY